ncbi:hypothetical protein [Acaryochloris sp. IP29b_bin.137]|nr:hypothetical protein [Acaryochloris sp. IP29b_bin.137]
MFTELARLQALTERSHIGCFTHWILEYARTPHLFRTGKRLQEGNDT